MTRKSRTAALANQDPIKKSVPVPATSKRPDTAILLEAMGALAKAYMGTTNPDTRMSIADAIQALAMSTDAPELRSAHGMFCSMIAD